jgi:tetratricopeptide (TPR) repeat protein
MNRKERRAAQSQGGASAEAQAFFQQGAALHAIGKLAEAEAIYRRILDSEPRHADSLHAMGLIALAVNQPQIAEDFIRRAIAINGKVAAYHNNLALVYNQLGRQNEAVASFGQAIRLDPNNPETHNNLGVVLDGLEKSERALACYNHALALKPDYTSAWYNKGNALLKRGDLAGASACFEKALDLRPGYVEAWNNLATVFKAQGRLKEALVAAEKALELKPDHVEAVINRGTILQEIGRLGEAETCLRQAIGLKPDNILAWSNLGPVLNELGRPAEAEAACRRALELDPHLAEAYNNLGAALDDQDRGAEALELYEKALALRPEMPKIWFNLGNSAAKRKDIPLALTHLDKAIALNGNYAEAHWNKAFIQLLAGNWAEGWRESEWRWRLKSFEPYPYIGPLWDGCDLSGKTILLHCEQGMGDSLQFIRYAPLVKAKGGRVLLACPTPLAALFSTAEGIDEILPAGAMPTHDAHAPLLSLPSIFGTTPDTVPAKIPYLWADKAKTAVWRERLAGIAGLKVGLVWAGNPNYKMDRLRSPRLEPLLPMLDVPGAHFFGLQQGDGRRDLEGRAMPPNFTDLAGDIHDFADTAAIMANLDLVISSCTAPAHLAGALGRPVWIMLTKEADWRWMLDRPDSPWYPTARLFRQAVAGDWAAVVAAMKDALADDSRIG